MGEVGKGQTTANLPRSLTSIGYGSLGKISSKRKVRVEL